MNEIIDVLKKILVQVDKWGDMLKSVYDPNADGVVKDSDKLEGQTLIQVRNHTAPDSDKLEGNTLAQVQNHPQKTNVKARAYLSSNQTIPHQTLTVVEFDTENYDPGSLFNISTHRFVAPFPCFCLVISMIEYLNIDIIANKAYCSNICINGSQWVGGGVHAAYVAGITYTISDIVPLDTDDYVEIKAWHNAGASVRIRAGSIRSYISVHLLSKT